ncbi:CHC2 zinc finger domain-containing protein [Pleomorphovibrio marinus]|uniref:CHC2 zinc finger domain-containing protein n=1 Tax=Pleomorphovibrio marinus TaxID=2164132 RepID=UPI000E0AC0E5|nr:CHC2 zinc finger domain-containing protein [Pleomorphovibrio marinus]
MDIREIKSRLALSQVLDYYGLKPDKNHRLHCPWHDEKTPSLQFYPKTNSWTSFNSNCSAGGEGRSRRILCRRQERPEETRGKRKSWWWA